ncbi:MAG TPA: GvpL/GvpF family gas vesicle protein, partial [Longimicrobiaceae bacterium]|nr:GvpL/GvpF family gas vesicle protein [Longimicrobiaceae bacterium]
ATPLPLRFGSVFADEGALRAVLAERADVLLAALERVAGKVEMGVAVGWDPGAARERILAAHPELRPAEEKPATGRAYLEARRREHAVEAALRGEAEALLDRLSSAVGEVLPGAEEVRTVLPAAGMAGTLAHLVLQGNVSSYREAVERVSGDVPDAEIRLSGPWAPYSFV